MRLEKLKRVEDLFSLSKSLQGLKGLYESYARKTDCDKHGFGFNNHDDRFSIFKCEITLVGYNGYYGNSGCSTIANLDNKDCKKYLSDVLQNNIELILNEMGELAKIDAKKMKGEAQAEIDTAITLLEKLG